MGYGAASDLSRLRYALLPTLPPLDTVAGAQALTDLLDGVQAEWPEHHLVVIFDTISRAVRRGELSRHLPRLLQQQRHRAQAPRYHLGAARSQRQGPQPGPAGQLRQGDDVDVVWNLARTENGVLLQRDFARMSWVTERVTSASPRSRSPYRRRPVTGPKAQARPRTSWIASGCPGGDDEGGATGRAGSRRLRAGAVKSSWPPCARRKMRNEPGPAGSRAAFGGTPTVPEPRGGSRCTLRPGRNGNQWNQGTGNRRAVRRTYGGNRPSPRSRPEVLLKRRNASCRTTRRSRLSGRPDIPTRM